MRVIIINAHYTNTLGGSEIQCHQIAEGLTQLKVDLTYLAVGGYSNTKQLPYKILSVEKKANALIDACKKIQPGIIYWRYNKNFLPNVLDAIELLNIPLVFSVSHIHDLEPFAYKSIPNLGFFQRMKRRVAHLIKGFRFQKAFKKVSGVVCNNEEHFKYIPHSNKVYIPNSPFLEVEEFQWPKPYIVWVGNIKAHKHPEKFIDLAKSLDGQGIDFLMVGDIQQKAYEYLNTSDGLPNNFKFLGPKSILKTNGIIKSSLFLVHTCEPEGFPNVFLQAWGFGKAIVSLQFDPASLLEKHELGFHSGSYQQLVDDCFSLIEGKNLRTEIGARANLYLTQHFVKGKNLKTLVDFLASTLGK